MHKSLLSMSLNKQNVTTTKARVKTLCCPPRCLPTSQHCSVSQPLRPEGANVYALQVYRINFFSTQLPAYWSIGDMADRCFLSLRMHCLLQQSLHTFSFCHHDEVDDDDDDEYDDYMRWEGSPPLQHSLPSLHSSLCVWIFINCTRQFLVLQPCI